MKEKSFGTDLSSLRLSEDVVTRQQPRDNPRCYIITTSHHSQQCCCHIVTVPLVLLRPHLRLALAPVSRPNWWPDSGSSADLLHHKRCSIVGFIVCCQNDWVSCKIINHRNKHINFEEKDQKGITSAAQAAIGVWALSQFNIDVYHQWLVSSPGTFITVSTMEEWLYLLLLFITINAQHLWQRWSLKSFLTIIYYLSWQGWWLL